MNPLRAVAIVVLVLLAISSAGAQKVDWPNKPVRFVVPFPPGGSNDQLARLLGARLAEITGQTFVASKGSGLELSVLVFQDLISRRYSSAIPA